MLNDHLVVAKEPAAGKFLPWEVKEKTCVHDIFI